jgi:hypothetical protein
LSIDYILKLGERLIKEYGADRKNGMGQITNLQLSFSGLERAERGQQGIAGFLGGASRDSPAPVTQVSEKALGKRKASEDIVDLTLDGDDSEAESASSSDDFAEIEPVGPVYRCRDCGAVISISTVNGEALAEATKRIANMHSEWHAKRKATESKQTGKRMKEGKKGVEGTKKIKKKRKGQQKLNSFFAKP